MFKHLVFLFVIVTLSAFPVLAAGKIGVVDVALVLNTSKAAQSIEAQREVLRGQFSADISKAEQALRQEEKILLKPPSSLSKEAYIQKREAYDANLLATRKQTMLKKRMLEEASNQAVNQLRANLTNVVENIANERGFELVISKKNVIAGQTSLDITHETLKRLDENLPEIKLIIKEK